MKKLRTYKCKPCKQEYEKLVNDDDTVICLDCGEECEKMLSLPRYLGNSTGKSPARR